MIELIGDLMFASAQVLAGIAMTMIFVLVVLICLSALIIGVMRQILYLNHLATGKNFCILTGLHLRPKEVKNIDDAVFYGLCPCCNHYMRSFDQIYWESMV